jgi:hypothetical protein
MVAHLVAAELYRVHGDSVMLEVRKNARTGISSVAVHAGGFRDLSSPDRIRTVRDGIAAAVQAAEARARVSIRLELHPSERT